MKPFVLFDKMQELEYFLPVSPSCLKDCDLCSHIGCRNDTERTQDDFLRALARAESGGFKNLLFSFHFLDWQHHDWALQEVFARGFKPRLRVRLQDGILNRGELQVLRSRGVNFEWVIDARRPFAWTFLSHNQIWREISDRFTVIVLKKHRLAECLETIPNNLTDKLHFYFPVPTGPEHLSPQDIFQLIRITKYRFPKVTLRPPEAYEVWEPRAPGDFGFEATHPVTIDHTSTATPKISVVIPVYNNRNYLLATLDHLTKQSLPFADFEVTVVDDGSTDGTVDALHDWLTHQPENFQFRLLQFPRKTKREMGDGFYRAGVARNLGVKHCRGEIVAFLDSDIVTPPHYLADLLDRHARVDVVQSVRLNLKEAVSSRFTRYADIDPHRHTEPFEGNYWLDFFSEPNWSDLPFYWKYTCTYGLSLRKEVFERVGRIRRTFIFYGFEDTDLGYRLAKLGYRFELSDALTYHLFHTTSRSEYRNSAEERHKVLSKTATIFFLNQLDEKIFSHFHGFLGGRA